MSARLCLNFPRISAPAVRFFPWLRPKIRRPPVPYAFDCKPSARSPHAARHRLLFSNGTRLFTVRAHLSLAPEAFFFHGFIFCFTNPSCSPVSPQSTTCFFSRSAYLRAVDYIPHRWDLAAGLPVQWAARFQECVRCFPA